MQISKQKINSTLQKQLYKTLFQLIVDLKTIEEAQIVLEDLLSDAELTTLTKRLGIAYWLSKKRSYSNIKDNLKVSSASVADVQQNIKGPGWKLALTKVMADEWATVWESKIKSMLNRK